ncbi:MAG: tRNA (N6-threonylcarbamoyladenosine(37)-N6)-methyltransferase TrmO [Lachnospiraceae bacterium]|nr:tRNA (N6-threonylcarbamoyladenosine(37)-N6)-methyltransferase TrmO [Lachnospiraceae bacterium]
MKIIGHIHTDFPAKFGVPRQSGLVPELKATITFEPEYRIPEAFRGLEEFSHIWLLWKFSKSEKEHWSATVKPPRLGGKKRMGVFATRSPYRPNDIGLSSVKLEKIEFDEQKGPILHVAGADLVDGTPIYDIKPYIAYADSHPEATEGFAGTVKGKGLTVIFPQELLACYPEEKREAIVGVLKQDPRPAYDIDETRVYGVEFAGYDVRFTVTGDVLTVKELVKLN